MRFSNFTMLVAITSATAAAGKPSPKVDPKKAAAVELVRAQLKDGRSAEFKELKTLDNKGSFCGWVNAKNSFGGYTGFSVFYVTNDGKVVILPPEQSVSALC